MGDSTLRLVDGDGAEAVALPSLLPGLGGTKEMHISVLTASLAARTVKRGSWKTGNWKKKTEKLSGQQHFYDNVPLPLPPACPATRFPASSCHKPITDNAQKQLAFFFALSFLAIKELSGKLVRWPE